MKYTVQQGYFLWRFRYTPKVVSGFRKLWYGMMGMRVGNQTLLPKLITTWPHQVAIGDHCQLEKNITFKYDGIWQQGPSIRIKNNVFIGAGCEFNINTGIDIGNDANIASGCKFIDHDHGTVLGTRIGAQPSVRATIVIGEDVWLGANVIVLKGVTIGSGAIVAAGAVVNKSIAENQIWGGIPAKFIKMRV